MRVAILFCACLLATASFIRAKSQNGGPIWKQRLIQGSQPSSAKGVFSSVFFSPSALEGHSPGLTFLGNSRLVVHEVAPTGQLSKRGGGNSSAFVLHALVVDAESGTVVLSKDWPTRPDRVLQHSNSSIQTVRDGLLVRTGQVLALYSWDLTPIQDLRLSGDDPNDTWLVSVSPSGKTLLVNRFNRKQSFFSVLDAGTLQLKNSWNGTPLRNSYSISDSMIAAADTNQRHIGLSEFGTNQWETITKQNDVGCIQTPVFLTDGLLANPGCGFSLIDSKGQVLMMDHDEQDQRFERKVASGKKGEIAAVAQMSIRGGGFWDTDTHVTAIKVIVYDLILKTRVMTLELAPVPKRFYDFALSPDGSKIAVLNDGEVAVYRIPVQ